MSRDIKFRAWSESKKTMLYLCDSYKGKVSIVMWPKMRACAYTSQGTQTDLPLMQFTGCQDRKGNDIYEGDIIECDDDSCPWWTVFWSSISGGWYIECGDDCLELVETASYDLVVGNIHENPELLQDKAS